jgi:predicted transcriptional regulator
MSIEVTIRLPGADQSRLKAIAEKLPRAGKLSMKARRSFPLFGGLADFQVSSVGDGIAENATERGEFVLLNDETKRSLTELLKAFGALTSVFTIYAAQSGDLPKRETTVTLEKLLELSETNHLGKRVTYWVRPPELTLRAPEQENPAEGK